MNHILGSPDVVINEEEGYSALSHELQQKISTLLSKHQATPTSHTQRMEPVRVRMCACCLILYMYIPSSA